jgi:hypothetical protein
MSPTALATTVSDDLDDLAADLAAFSLSANGYAVMRTDPLCEEEINLSRGDRNRQLYGGSSVGTDVTSPGSGSCLV